jgi:hypothetical protein
MSKVKTRSRTRALGKTKKRRNTVLRAAGTSRASAEPPDSLPLPARRVQTPFLFWATVPFRMMDMWFRAYAPKG